MKTLLVLEYDPPVMKLLGRMLKDYRVVSATTPEEALMSFIDLNHRVDLLLADLTLPTMSGIQVALLLRKKLPAVPVILTSGNPSSSWSRRDSADLQRLGSKSVVILQKPLETQVLLKAVSELLGTSSAGLTTTA